MQSRDYNKNFDISDDKLIRLRRLDMNSYCQDIVISKEEFIACYEAWIEPKSQAYISLNWGKRCSEPKSATKCDDNLNNSIIL